MYECCICNQHGRNTLSGILRHIREVHPHFKGKVPCGVNGCPATPSSYEGLRQHIHRYHKDLLNVSVIEASSEHQNEEQGDGLEEEAPQSQETMNTPSICESTTAIGAKFILKTRDGKRLTQTATNGIIEDSKILVQNTLDIIKRKVVTVIQNSATTDDILSEVDSLFSDETLVNPFSGLETPYKQEKFIQQNFNYVAPVERVLGRGHRVKSNGSVCETKESCYDVPLLQSLQALLKNQSVRDQIFNSHKLGAGKMGDFCDGEYFEHHALFKDDPGALQICLYYDDLETCNVLGSKTKKHKLGLFYYMLGNIDPKFRSRTETIQLLAIVRTVLINKYGINKILEPFIKEINLLERDSGVPFLIDDKLTSLRGTLLICSADNPAACTLGGFKYLHSSFRKCRNCMAMDTDMQTKFNESDLQLRTRDTYTSHTADLDGPLRGHIATTYGVSGNSILNSSRYFHVVDGLAPDIMHDILEGTTQLTLKCLIRHLIYDKKLFTLGTLNERVSSFQYGIAEQKNKPSEISQSSLQSDTLKQSATQAWCLARFFPLLVGDMVPEADERWNHYLLLLKIMELVFAPVTTIDKTYYLEMLIEEFLSEFRHLYPERLLTPKMHYLIHVPSWTRRFGPLIRSWCMRYESKNKYFKSIAVTLGNFTNIEKTVATRHQQFMCYKMECSTHFLGGDTGYGRAISTIVGDLEYRDALTESSPSITLDSTVHRVSYAEINGTLYSQGSIVLCTFDEDIPIFGKIVDLIVTEWGNCLFILLPYTGSSFSHHFNSYEVTPNTDHHLIYKQSDLADYHPLSLSKSFGPCFSHQTFVCLKYNI